MPGAQLLEVAIGLIFLYLVLSLIASAILEVIENAVHLRARHLWQGIGELVGDRAAVDGCQAVEHADERITLASVYRHPIISALFRGEYAGGTGLIKYRNLPSYIPSASFATVIIDLAARRHSADGVSAIQALRLGVDALPDTPIKQALGAIMRMAGDDLSAVQEQIARWYDTSMDRVSGGYKRYAQVMLVVIGSLLAVAANADTYSVAVDLATNEPKRKAIVKAAEEFAASHTAANLQLSPDQMRAYLAMYDETRTPLGAAPRFTVAAIVGYLLTGFAVSLGAAFWFDLLNKFMVIRSTVKPHEKSPEEGSEDRQPRSGEPRRPTAFLR